MPGGGVRLEASFGVLRISHVYSDVSYRHYVGKIRKLVLHTMTQFSMNPELVNFCLTEQL